MSVTTASNQIENLVAKAMKYAEENTAVVGASAAVAILASFLVIRKTQLKRDGSDYNSQNACVKLLNNEDHTLKGDEFSKSIDDYEGMFKGAREKTGEISSDESIKLRQDRYADMVNHFYNLVTDFYEYGWGQSFHFAPRWKNETFIESIYRAEHFLAARLGLNSKSRCMDIGCGIGGPMRNISRFSGAEIRGITINQYQVNAGTKYNKQKGLENKCSLIRGDFQNLPWKDGEFDAAYQIEATCHSPNRVITFSGINRCLKDGGVFAGYEWVVTPKYDPKNPLHVQYKEGIEVGNGLPTLVYPDEIVRCLEASGFEVIEHYDANRGVHDEQEIPWYDTLNGKMSLSGFRMTHVGRVCTHAFVWFLETIRVAPAGTTKVSALLNATAIDLVESGKRELFTPSYFFLAKKVRTPPAGNL